MSATELKAEGNKMLAAKQYSEAIENYTKAIELDDKDHTFFGNRSMAYLYNGEPEKAVADADKCIEIKGDWAKGYIKKAQAFQKMGDFDNATKAVEAGLAVLPDESSLQDCLKEVERASMAPPPGGGLGGLFGPEMLTKLAGHPKFGPKLADPAFQQKLAMMQSNPNAMLQDPEMMEVLQAVLMSGQDGNGTSPMDFMSNPPPAAAPAPAPSLSAEQKAAANTKTASVAAKEKGNALYKEKKFDEAIAAYEEAATIDPNNILFLSNKAAVYVEMGETDKAIALCEEALEIGNKIKAPYEDKAKVLQRIATAHVKKNDFATAIEWYQKAQLENFDKATERKIKNMELERVKKARADYINPELGLAAKERGNDNFREGKFPEAIKEYEDCIKRDPTNAPFRNNLAAAYLKMGLFNDAKREVEKSLDIDPKYVKAWAKKGDIEVFMKEYHKAMESYKSGLQLEPDNRLCKDGMNTVTMKINTSQTAEDQEQRQAHAMADPEIQSLLQDPSVRQTLQDMQENPAYAQKAMSDPVIRAKIEKLVAAGVLQVK